MQFVNRCVRLPILKRVEKLYKFFHFFYIPSCPSFPVLPIFHILLTFSIHILILYFQKQLNCPVFSISIFAKLSFNSTQSQSQAEVSYIFKQIQPPTHQPNHPPIQISNIRRLKLINPTSRRLQEYFFQTASKLLQNYINNFQKLLLEYMMVHENQTSPFSTSIHFPILHSFIHFPIAPFSFIFSTFSRI